MRGNTTLDLSTQAPPNLVGCPIHPTFGIGIDVDEDKTLDSIWMDKLGAAEGRTIRGQAWSYPFPTELHPLLGSMGSGCPPLYAHPLPKYTLANNPLLISLPWALDLPFLIWVFFISYSIS